MSMRPATQITMRSFQDAHSTKKNELDIHCHPPYAAAPVWRLANRNIEMHWLSGGGLLASFASAHRPRGQSESRLGIALAHHRAATLLRKKTRRPIRRRRGRANALRLHRPRPLPRLFRRALARRRSPAASRSTAKPAPAAGLSQKNPCATAQVKLSHESPPPPAPASPSQREISSARKRIRRLVPKPSQQK